LVTASYPSTVTTREVALEGVEDVYLFAVVQVIDVEVARVGLRHAIPSIVTVTVPVAALLRVIVTVVPPVIYPYEGEIDDTKKVTAS